MGAIGVLSSDTRVYGGRAVLVSGDCKRETGIEHMSLINATFEAGQKSGLRTISIASDGESRRGQALVQFTFKRKLSPDSSIYDQLSPLEMMNLEVGDDDVTADKDYKHIFKRLRNLCLRDKGIYLFKYHIVPSGIRSQWHSNQVSLQRSSYLLNPEDKQDVRLAYDFLHEVWVLPDSPSDATPGFRDHRFALQILGELFRNVILPYICVDLSLSEQLVHLSFSAHLLMGLWSDKKATTHLMPTQLYVDIMIMIKNAYFCVAKAKVDDPDGEFWLILLGTDRLETLFGILQTMVGNDANLNILQLGQRLTGMTEVSTILAKYPHWDRAPRRLVLPALSKDGFEIHQGVDHVGPASWRGDIHVANIVLYSTWKLGKLEAERRFPFLIPVLASINQLGRDILSPLGKDLVKAPRDADNVDDTYEDIPSSLANAANPAVGPDLEDAVMEEESSPDPKHQPFFMLNGTEVSKAQYLSQAFQAFKKAGSTDRLKRVAQVQRYSPLPSAADVITRDPLSATNLLTIDMPIASLLKCEDCIFLCIGEVNNIILDGASVDEIDVDSLQEDSVVVSYQMLYLTSATVSDDPTLKYDWRSSYRRGMTFKVSGHLIQPVDPGISAKSDSQPPHYLFESEALLGASALLLQHVGGLSSPVTIPNVKRSTDFPYVNGTNGAFSFLSQSFSQALTISVREGLLSL